MASATFASRTAVPQFPVWSNQERKPKTPYGLSIVDNCATCEFRSSESFCGLSDAALKALQKIRHTTTYPAGAMIFMEGQPVRGLYILCTGRVKLQTTNSDGRTLILKIAQQGEGLGLNSVITGKPYEMTAEILQPSQIAFISREDFMKFLKEYGDACLHFAQHLSRDCHSAYEMVRSLGLSQSVADRMAKFLLEWSSTGTATDGMVRVKLALTHQEIAQLIGTSRETVTRILSDFKKQRYIEVNGATMLLRNKSALEAMAAA